MVETLVEHAPAKINLALHVREKRADGYHALHTIFAFADVGDTLSAAPADALSLAVEGPFAAGLADEPDNLVLRAARALAEEAGVEQGAALTLTKNLPIASGIGGGSADAAAALRLLNRLWGTGFDEERLCAIGARLGADIPACVLSRTCRGEGRGDELTGLPASNLGGLSVLLVNPRVALSTAQVFAAWDGQDRGPLGRGDPLEAAMKGRNDLESPASILKPVIGQVLAELTRQRPLIARMSGSGATCFALFGSFAQCLIARQTLADDHPDWWVQAGRLL